MTLESKNNNHILKSTHIIIIAWCLLPIAAALGYAFYTYRMVQYEQAGINLFYSGLSLEVQKAQAANYWMGMARDAYYSMFDILGAITIATALFCVILWIASNRNMLPIWIKERPWIPLLAAVLLASAVSCAVSDDPQLCWTGNDYRHEGLFSYIVYFSLLVCISLTETENRVIYLRLLAISGTIMAVLMLCQYYDIPHFNDITCPVATVFFQYNHMGYYLNISLVTAAGLFIYEHKIRLKFLCISAIGITVFALIRNDTFGCYLAAGFTLGVCVLFASLKFRRFSIAALVPLLLFLCISAGTSLAPKLKADSEIESIEDSTVDMVSSNFTSLASDVNLIIEDDSEDGSNSGYAGHGRMSIWRDTINLIKENPFIGYGPDGLDPDKYIIAGYGRPHNEFLQYALFCGIPAALCYIAALILIFIRQIKHINKLPAWTVIAAGGVTAYLISSLFGNTTFYVTPYFFMLLGMAMDTKKLQDA